MKGRHTVFKRAGPGHDGPVPELPDVTVYVERLRALTKGAMLDEIRLQNPFLLRSARPAREALLGRRVVDVSRLGKRIVCALEGEVFFVLHLMIAGRLTWTTRDKPLPPRRALAAFDFSTGTLVLTEAGTKRRASLHFVEGRAALVTHDPGGIEVLTASFSQFKARMVEDNHTLKRALTDPRKLSGIGNAYSDEILHRARLSPIAHTQKLDDTQLRALYDATRAVLREWTGRFRAEVGEGFPEKVTAFRPEMAVHGKYAQPCPVCETLVQRIVYAKRETNYCPTCQTGGKLLADRGLSRLLKKDWPNSLEALENLRRTHRASVASTDDATRIDAVTAERP